MISHTFLGVEDLQRAESFYQVVLTALGWKARFSDPEHGRAGWGPVGGGRPLFVVGRPFDRRPVSVGNGAMIALTAPDRPTVDRVHALAIKAGGHDEGAPGLRAHYHPNFYGGYFRDLDGNKLCVCSHGAAGDVALNRAAMLRLADEWIAAWNRGDVDAVVAGFAPEATFHSPYARQIVGQGRLTGREEIGAYWRAALNRIGHLRFDLLDAVCDETRQTMVVRYEADLGGERRRACELFRFEGGLKIEGEALYGDVFERLDR